MFLSKAEVRPLSGTCHEATFRDFGSISRKPFMECLFEQWCGLAPGSAAVTPASTVQSTKKLPGFEPSIPWLMSATKMGVP